MKAHRWSFVAGILLLLVTVLAGVLGQAQPCGALPRGYAPVIAFELARTPGDLALLFGERADACQAAFVAAMNTANWGDLLLYMPLYGAFLVLFFAGFLERHRRVAAAGMAIVVLSVMFDVVENVYLFRITADLPRAPLWLGGLAVATSVKWLGLGVVGVLAAYLVRSFGGVGKLGGLLCLVVLPVSIATVIDPRRFGPAVTLAVGGSWVVIMVFVATRRADRSSLSGARR